MNKEQQKWIFLAIGVAVFLYLYFSFLFQPASNKVKTLKNEYVSSKQVLEEAKQKISILPALEKDALKLKEELYYTMKRLPIEEDLPALLKIISHIASDSGINITNFEPGKQSAKDFYVEIPFKLSITTSYHKLGTFLNNLSYQPRLIIVTDIQMVAVASSESNVGLTISATVFLSSYVTKQAGDSGKSDSQNLVSADKDLVIRPFYLYDRRNKRDPFKPLNIIEITARPSYVAINTLKLTGIISFPKIKTATLEDVNASKYTLTDGVLYANDMSIIEDVTGMIEKNRVILKQVDKDTKKLRIVVLELKKSEE